MVTFVVGREGATKQGCGSTCRQQLFCVLHGTGLWDCEGKNQEKTTHNLSSTVTVSTGRENGYLRHEPQAGGMP